MTREEAIEILKEDSCVDCACANMSYAKCEYEGNCDIRTAMNMAIEALKAEPCDDAVKREAVLNTLDTMDKALDEDRTVEAYKELLKECYKELPPVTPTAKESLVVRDAVSKQAVLDKIKEVCFSKEQKWVDFRVSHGSNGQRDFIINFIESLPPVTPKQRWIPVSERLPEESGSYLTTTRNNAVRVNHFYAGHGHQVFGYRNNVIAWMPLPEPYKEGDSE